MHGQRNGYWLERSMGGPFRSAEQELAFGLGDARSMHQLIDHAAA